MPRYFAYGSNMSRNLMRRHCPRARALGTAVLADHRFIVMAEGFATIIAEPGQAVHGVLWELSDGDVAALDDYESVDTGLYRAATLPVYHAGGVTSALVYIARSCEHGRPKPAYMKRVLAAARDWDLPEPYIDTLARWAPAVVEGWLRPEVRDRR
jgi:gamma-glutamylcyclotransferase (GGCT)/AIG2-like uncharacterized protein YtfP